MDEALRRRLVGAGVLLAGAFMVSELLPDTRLHSGHAAERVVTYDLRTGRALDPAPVVKAPAPPPAEPTAAPSAAVAPQADEGKPAPASANMQPAKSPEAKASEPKSAGTLSRPVLKVDESFGAKPAPTPAGSEWFVQIGSFSSQANARSALQKLYGAGLPALIQTVPVGKKLWYRVRVGPYAAENAATQALGKARAQGYRQAALVKPDAGPAAGKN